VNKTHHDVNIHATMLLQGFAAFVDENLNAFEACSARHSATDCALYFEALGLPEEKVFFHADQVSMMTEFDAIVLGVDFVHLLKAILHNDC
jgi:hypothetical protein